MPDRSCKILLVEPDSQVCEILVASLARRFGTHITCVADADSALDADMLDPHHLVIAELALDQPSDVHPPSADLSACVSRGMKLAEQLARLSGFCGPSDPGRRPLILLAHELTCDQAIEAMRAGVVDLFRKPFPVASLLDAAEQALHNYRLRRQQAAKYRRMRDLVRQALRERRDLNRRMELLCRDLVGAHRRLVRRVLALEETKPRQSA